MMENKKNKYFNILIGLIVVVALVAISYFVYRIFSISPDQEPNVITENDIIKMGMDKFELLSSKTNIYDNKPIFFTNEDLNINNISNQDILNIAYSRMSQEDKNGVGEVKDYCFDKSLDLYTDDCYKETFDKSLLQEQIKYFFSGDIKYNFENFNTSGNLLCTINNDTYTCTLNKNPFYNDYILTVRMFDSVKKNGDYLEVYSYLITIVRKPINNKESGIYSDANSTNKIDDITFFDENVNDNLNKDNYKKLINKYKDKATKYKSTFKSFEEDYVWVSTEIVK